MAGYLTARRRRHRRAHESVDRGGGLCRPMPLFVGEDRGGGSSRWKDVLEGYDVLYGSDRRFQVVRYGPHKSAASLTCGTRDDEGTCVGLYPDGALSSGGQHEGLCVWFSW
jgi:hypothetical protein